MVADHRIDPGKEVHPEGVQERWHPSGVQIIARLSGGLRYVPTSGYSLAALRAAYILECGDSGKPGSLCDLAISYSINQGTRKLDRVSLTDIRSLLMLTRIGPMPYRLFTGLREFDHELDRFSAAAFAVIANSMSASCPIPQPLAMENQPPQIYVRALPQTILLVEDFDDTRLMMRLWLVKNGYRVVEAENGEEAIRFADAERPDLIIMDVMMPGMNGLDATRRIREHEALRETPIVAVSAYGADEYRARAIESGCTEYVSTPFEPSELEELIRSLLATTRTPVPNGGLPENS